MVGPTGVGKTRWAYEHDPTLYPKPNGHKWFDGYLGHKTALFDDFRGDASGITYSFLLQLLDRYPLRVEVKGGMVEWVPETIIITSNDDPRYWYPMESNLAPLFRRLTTVKIFSAANEYQEIDGGLKYQEMLGPKTREYIQ